LFERPICSRNLLRPVVLLYSGTSLTHFC
jgi:hypothetical protein